MKYKGKTFKQIHDSNKVTKWINDEGLILTISKNTSKIEESYGNDNGHGYLLTRANLFGDRPQKYIGL